jgi:hypothetical protein
MTILSRLPQHFTALSSIEERALFGGWDARDIVVMLYGFFDESGEHDQDGTLAQLTLGGFIARWPDIQSLCQKWRAALDNCHMAEFHMRVCFRRSKIQELVARAESCARRICRHPL